MATNINNGETGVSVRTKINNAWAEINSLIATAVTLTGTQVLTNKTLTLPKINDTSSDNQYIFAVSELAANRTVTLPLLGANDTFVFAAFAQTLTNKTLTSPAITTPTGIVKGDVGLGNLDNTSDANKPVSTATSNALALKQDANFISSLIENIIIYPGNITVSDSTYLNQIGYITNVGASIVTLNGGGSNFPLGGTFSIWNLTASVGSVTLTAGGGVTLDAGTPGSLVVAAGRGAVVKRLAANHWVRFS